MLVALDRAPRALEATPKGLVAAEATLVPTLIAAKVS